MSKKCAICNNTMDGSKIKYCGYDCAYKTMAIKQKERKIKKEKEYQELPFARMNIMMKDNRLWLDVTDIYQFSKKVNERI